MFALLVAFYCTKATCLVVTKYLLVKDLSSVVYIARNINLIRKFSAKSHGLSIIQKTFKALKIVVNIQR